MQKMIVQIFRSSKKEGAYLYVKKGQNLSTLPDELLNLLGRLDPAMVLVLTEDKKLANADAKKVMASILDSGYYLQLPPVNDEDDYRKKIPNAKLL